MIGFEDIQTTFVVILAACAAFASLYGVFKTVKEIKKPSEARDERLDTLERDMKNTKARITQMELGNGLILKAQLCLIDSHLHGDNEDRLSSMKLEIEDYLISMK